MSELKHSSEFCSVGDIKLFQRLWESLHASEARSSCCIKNVGSTNEISSSSRWISHQSYRENYYEIFTVLVCSKLRHGYETTMWRKVYKRVEKLGKRWRRRATWKISSTLYSLNFHNFIVRKSICRVELRGEEKVVGENEDEGDFEFRSSRVYQNELWIYFSPFLHFFLLLRYKLCESGGMRKLSYFHHRESSETFYARFHLFSSFLRDDSRRRMQWK